MTAKELRDYYAEKIISDNEYDALMDEELVERADYMGVYERDSNYDWILVKLLTGEKINVYVTMEEY